MRVGIAGGGIAGLTLANALRGSNAEVHLFERTEAWAPAGAGIVLGANAIKILAGCGLEPALLDAAREVESGYVTTARGKTLSAMRQGKWAASIGRTLAIHRAELHRVLAEGCQDAATVRLGETVIGATADGARAVATLDSGVEETFDVLVGADGINSCVRERVFGEAVRRYSGYTCWRLVVDIPGNDFAVQEMWGAGRRFGVVPLKNGQVYCFATLNAPSNSTEMRNLSIADFCGLFRDFGGNVPVILDALRQGGTLIHGDLEEVRAASWVQGRAVLIGDAAHAMTPNLGQGAGMAIEDAHVLADELAKQDTIESALTAYEKRRRGRVRKVQDRSWQIGRVAQWENRLACALRNAALALTPDAWNERAVADLLSEAI